MLRLDYAGFRYGPSPKVLERLSAELGSINKYPDESYDELKEALSRRFGLPKSFFLIGNGLDEIIDLITRSAVQQDDEVIIPAPTFSQYELAARRAGGQPVFVDCMAGGTYTINAEDICGRATQKTRIIWVCSPNNPTGGTTAVQTIERLAARSSCLVVVDEALYDFDEESAVELITSYRNVVILRTFSKAYCLAGLRVGFAIANPQIVGKLEECKQPFNVNALAVRAATAALDDQQYYDSQWRALKAERAWEIAELERLGIAVVGRESNFLLLDFGSVRRSEAIYAALLERDIKIFLGSDREFSRLSGRYCRVIVGRTEENRRFINALQQVLEAIP